MALTFAKIAVSFQLQKNFPNRYFFFSMKSSFEAAFRTSIGCQPLNCGGCRLHTECIAGSIFSQELSSDPAAIKKYQKPSLPFAFQFPLIPDTPNKGAEVEVEIILMGATAEHYGHFVQALCTVVQGHMALLRVASVDYGGDRYLLSDGRGTAHTDCLFLFSAEELQKTGVPVTGEIAVNIMSPLFLLRDGRPLRELSFAQFITALFRRVSSLVYYYGGLEMDCDFKRLAEESLAIKTVESSLSWTDWPAITKGAKVAGITGRIVFAGELDSFQSFLLLGQYFNVGKGASYGRGRYLIDHRQ